MSDSQKVAVITGGTGALGKAVTLALARAGYYVVVTYRDLDELSDLKKILGSMVDQLEAHEVDVTSAAALETFANGLKKKHGGITSVITLVGGFASGTLGDTVDQQFDKMMLLNAKSFLLTVNAMVPVLHGPASIIAVAARPALEPVKNLGVYAASKAAVVSLVKTLAIELRDQDITVNAIAPSTIDTPANRVSMPKVDPNKWVTPDQIAQAIVYLATQRPVSGTILPVYGKA
jgi:NAD(P)-dependent dehydrogenase (short-subunit alcohol dehydrogenase family)